MTGKNRIAEILNSPGTTADPAPSPVGTRSSQPTSAPTSSPTTSGGGGAGEVRFSPGALRQLGVNLERELEDIFRQARYKLNAKPRDVQSSAFTTFGFACALVHTEVIEYADEDLKTKTELAMDFNDRLQRTAIVQEETERKNTINGGG